MRVKQALGMVVGSWITAVACSGVQPAEVPGGSEAGRADAGAAAEGGRIEDAGVGVAGGGRPMAAGGRAGSGSAGSMSMIPDASAQTSGQCNCPEPAEPPEPEIVSVPCDTTRTESGITYRWAVLERSEDDYELDRTLVFVAATSPAAPGLGETLTTLLRGADRVGAFCGAVADPPPVRFVLQPR